MDIELRQADRDDVPRLAELVSQANDAPYDFRPVAAEKLGPGVSGLPWLTVAFHETTPVGVSVTCGNSLRLLAVARQFRRKGIGTRLFEEAEDRMRRSGSKRLRVAAESGNYFTPGVWNDDNHSAAFLARCGCRAESVTSSLRVDLARVDPPAPDHRVRRARRAEQGRILDLVRAEFAASWAFEVSRAFDTDPPSLFISEIDGRFAGFSAHEANNRGLGSFGPEGVVPRFRGEGLGRILLLYSLFDLKQMAYATATIPWVSSIDFYELSCGAEVAEKFTVYTKELPT